ncbi:MAG: type II CAAX endopeptidase family protein [Patescibacteria group bacterium]
MSANLLGKALYAVGLTIWVVLSFAIGQSLAVLLLTSLPLDLNDSVLTTIAAALSYVLGLTLALGVPALASKKFISKKTLGIDRLPSWSNIGLGFLAVLPYYIVSGLLVWLGLEVFKVINPEVGQQIGFENLTLRVEYLVAFITLVIMAPLAEELLFRGYFLGRLTERNGKWLALLVTSVVFGLMHLVGASESGIVLQWGAAADTFAMGLVAGALRLLSGSIWAGVVLHSVKNAIAFYFLFINPLPPGGM